MVNEILSAVGVPFKKTRFLKPPKVTYAVYLDDYSRRAADEKNLIKEHDVTIEIYSEKIDEEVEEKIENALDQRVLEYQKQDWYYIKSEQLFQLIYEFSYIEKGV